MFVIKNKKNVRINQTERLQILFQISIMLSQKIKITQALEMILKTSKSKKSQIVCSEILKKIRQGNSIAESVDDVLKPPAFFCSIIKSGEQTGHLGEYLFEAYKYSKNNLELKNKQKMQSFYPIFVFCSTFILSIGIIAFAIPTMVSMAESLGLALPAATISIINFIDWLKLYWPYVSVLILIFIGLVVYLKRKYSYFINWVLLKIPFVG
ncbi:MAG: type II secretion system F family protein, partial [Caldisericia bacterium]|nr:type II secretion system F family protein [Caldisericia bacterium]